MPLPPMPSTTTLLDVVVRRAGPSTLARRRRPRPRAARAGAAAASNMPRVSSRRSRHAAVSRRRSGSMPSASALASEPVVLGVVDRLGLVDEHDRDVVLDRVAPLEARVVERVLVLEVEQRALVLGAGEDLEQLGSRPSGQSPRFGRVDEGADLGDVRVARRRGRRASRLSRSSGSVLRRPQVEPPVAEVDGEAVEPVLVGVGVGGGDVLDHGQRVGDLGVDLARRGVALERLAQLRQRHAGPAAAARARAARR